MKRWLEKNRKKIIVACIVLIILILVLIVSKCGSKSAGGGKLDGKISENTLENEESPENLENQGNFENRNELGADEAVSEDLQKIGGQEQNPLEDELSSEKKDDEAQKNAQKSVNEQKSEKTETVAKSESKKTESKKPEPKKTETQPKKTEKSAEKPAKVEAPKLEEPKAEDKKSEYQEKAKKLFEEAEGAGDKSQREKLLSEAAENARLALSERDDDPVMHNILGEKALYDKDYLFALEEFENSLKYDANNYLYYYNLGKTQYVLKRYGDSINSFQKCCQLNKSFAAGQFNLGMGYSKVHEMEKALEAYDRALVINPNYEKAWLEKARVSAKLDHIDSIPMAIAAYKKVLRINEKNDSALMELASLYYDSGNFTESEKYYRMALAGAKPGAGVTLANYNLSVTLYETGELSEALNFAALAYENENFVSDKKQRSNIAYNYAFLLDRSGKKREAMDIYSEALKYNPDNQKAQINLGAIYMAQKPPAVEPALALFKRAYEIDKNSFEANNNLGSAYLELGDYENSVAHFEKALSIDEKNTEVKYNLARAYTQNESWEKATSAYIELLKADSKNWDLYIELAKVYMTMGDSLSAEKWLLYIQTANPDYRTEEVAALMSAVE